MATKKKSAKAAEPAEPAGPPPRTPGDEIRIAIGKLWRRSDVVVDTYASTGRQWSKKVDGVLPPDYEVIGRELAPLKFAWHFRDDPPGAGIPPPPPRRRGWVLLRGASEKGWWDVESIRKIKDHPTFWPGLLRTHGLGDPMSFREDGAPWPTGTRFAIVEGVEEAGVVLRVDPSGRTSYASFDSDGDTKEIGTDFGVLLRALLARGFEGGLGGRATPEVQARLAKDVPPRVSCDLTILENAPLDWPAYRALRLGGLPQFQLEKLGKLYGIEGLAGLPLPERSARLAAATAGDVSADVMGETMKIVVGAKKGKKDYDAWRLIEPSGSYSRITCKLEPRPAPGEKTELVLDDLWGVGVAVQALSEVPGFSSPLDPDTVRYLFRRLPEIAQAEEPGWTPADVRILTAPTAWVSTIAPGKYDAPIVNIGRYF
jgi:hypothetical protein